MVDLLRFQEAAELWQQLIARNESRQVDAERTQKFWQESGSRITVSSKIRLKKSVNNNICHAEIAVCLLEYCSLLALSLLIVDLANGI